LAAAGQAELVFVVDVSSLTKKGFVGTTNYEGRKVDLEFDAEGAGVSLTAEMASRLHVRKGSTLSVIIEDERTQVTEATVAAVGRGLRISDQRVYYAVGREGGAIVRIRKS
jgi:ABC-type lipoprotein release transport system permease subunit